MSIAAECPACCSCPEPTVEWDSVSVNLGKRGITEPVGHISSPPKVYRQINYSGDYDNVSGSTRNVVSWSGSVFLDDTASLPGSNLIFRSSAIADGQSSTFGDTSCSATLVTSTTNHFFNGFNSPPFTDDYYYAFSSGSGRVEFRDIVGFSGAFSPTTRSVGPGTCDSGYLVQTLSDEYTTAQLKTNTLAALPAFDDDWNDTPGAYAETSADELTYLARRARYRLRFPLPQVRTGRLYRVSWVERFIPKAGVGISSVEIRGRGVYRPAVTLSGGGGSGAVVVALMASDGSVSGYRILNPGSGYTSAPAVAVAAAINGGTTATATAVVAGGLLVAITPGAAGNYLPQLAFSAPPSPGVTATATCTLDEQGGLASVALGAAGSGYTSAPTLAITSRVSGATAADLLLHLGTETARCAVWDGVAPEDYDPADSATYPVLGDGANPYFAVEVPSLDGTLLTANVRAVCDGSPCPE